MATKKTAAPKPVQKDVVAPKAMQKENVSTKNKSKETTASKTLSKEKAAPKTEQKLLSTKVLKTIATHKTASAHLQKASDYHLDAASHHESGDHDKAHESGIKAFEHFSLAEDAMIENAKLKAIKNK
jgi:hypothetical protein